MFCTSVLLDLSCFSYPLIKNFINNKKRSSTLFMSAIGEGGRGRGRCFINRYFPVTILHSQYLSFFNVYTENGSCFQLAFLSSMSLLQTVLSRTFAAHIVKKRSRNSKLWLEGFRYTITAYFSQTTLSLLFLCHYPTFHPLYMPWFD